MVATHGVDSLHGVALGQVWLFHCKRWRVTAKDIDVPVQSFVSICSGNGQGDHRLLRGATCHPHRSCGPIHSQPGSSLPGMAIHGQKRTAIFLNYLCCEDGVRSCRLCTICLYPFGEVGAQAISSIITGFHP